MSQIESAYGDEATVDAVVAIASDIFESHFVFDGEVRRKVARMWLNSGRIVEYIGQKYELIQRVIDKPVTGTRDPFVVAKPAVTLAVGLDAKQRAEVIAANPDVDITYIDSPDMPHGKAAAARIIHEAQALNLVSHHSGTVLDIGGNYLRARIDKPNRTYQRHCCTLLDGELEYHRQTQRDVMLDYGDMTDVDYCTVGAENCSVRAPHGMTVHSLTAIDPDLWPTIFRKHGLEYVVNFFHYDVAIEVDDVGFMPAVDMHWARDGDMIQCHFENDSSHPYLHKRDWMLKYGSTWMMTEDDWEYVIFYELEYVHGGNAKSSFTRLEKSTLGHAESISQFRYLDVDECVDLTVPKYNPNYGKPISDPQAYDIEIVRVTMALFSHVLRFGISNDTERPDLPLTQDEVTAQCHAFNHVRRVNGTTLTVPYRLGSKTIDDVSLGMYLVIVKRAAINRVKYTAYTESMKRVQRRWGDESVVRLVSKAFSYAAIAPFLMLTQSLSDAVDLFVIQMRMAVQNDLVVQSAEQVAPYRVMSPIRTVKGTLHQSFDITHGNTPPDVCIPDDVSPRKFYNVFKDVMDPEHRRRVEEYLQTIDVAASEIASSELGDDENMPLVEKMTSNASVPSSHGDDADVDVTAEPVDISSRDDWITEYRKFQATLQQRELPPHLNRGHTFAERTNHSKVWDYAYEAIREYMMYNIDVGLHTLGDAVDMCTATWGVDGPRAADIKAKNIQIDAGIKYYKWNDGVVTDMSVEDRYAVIIDPVTKKEHFTFVKRGVTMALGVRSGWVFTCQSLKIFNCFHIANRAKKILANPRPLDHIKAKLVDGVPGCGKTYRIIQDFSTTDVVMTTVRETRDATYADMLRDTRFTGKDRQLKDRVRTNDSANMHGLPLADKLFSDEGLMAHWGGIAMAVVEARPSEVVMYGDSTQIRFIDRGSKIGNLHFESLFYWTQIVEINESVRCPADAMWVSAQFYPEERRPKIKTFSNRMRSIRYIHEPNVKSPLWEDTDNPWVTVSILRGDMGDLCDRNPDKFVRGVYNGEYNEDASKVKVFSVHEVQGRTKPLIRAIRISPFNSSVVNSPEHANVLFTRHDLYMDYISSLDPSMDMCSRYAYQATKLSDELLREMMLPVPDWLRKRLDSRIEKYERYAGR